MGAELFNTDGQTDMKLTVLFRNFANVPKNVIQSYKNCKCQLHYEENVFAESRGEFRPRQTRQLPRQTRQLPRAVDLKGRLLSCQSY